LGRAEPFGRLRRLHLLLAGLLVLLLAVGYVLFVREDAPVQRQEAESKRVYRPDMARAESAARERALEAFLAERSARMPAADRFRLFPPDASPGVPRRRWRLGRVSRNAFVFQETGALELELPPTGSQALLCYAGAEFGPQAPPGARARVRLVALAKAGPRILMEES